MSTETVAPTRPAGTATAPGRWQSLHVFYSADPRPLLTECVAPLVRDLRERGLLARYFFLNYWLEGVHVRLRLRPATEASTAEVLGTAEEAIHRFLARRPALYELDYDSLASSYEQMFALEYTEAERRRMYPDGRMPIQDNNTVQHRPYDPEYAKYGGPRGVEVAEWHFEHSSDLVLELLDTTNVHVRSVMLGIAAQLMMIMTSAFLRDTPDMANYLERYHDYWRGALDGSNEYSPDRCAANYERQAADLATRFAGIHTNPRQLNGFRGRWAAHCAELRERVDAAALDPAHLPTLLAQYTHMTNNRIGATMGDEAYLSYLLARTLRDRDGW